MNVEPLRASLLDAVAADAAVELEGVRAERAERLSEARRRADELIAQARRTGEADGAAEVAQRRARARREARTTVLAAQSAVYGSFRDRALAATERRRGSPDYGRLLDGLEALAREQLGPQAEVERDPPGRGGVVARSGARSVDYTLPALVERAIADLGGRLRELWA